MSEIQRYLAHMKADVYRDAAADLKERLAGLDAVAFDFGEKASEEEFRRFLGSLLIDAVRSEKRWRDLAEGRAGI